MVAWPLLAVVDPHITSAWLTAVASLAEVCTGEVCALVVAEPRAVNLTPVSTGVHLRGLCPWGVGVSMEGGCIY